MNQSIFYLTTRISQCKILIRSEEELNKTHSRIIRSANDALKILPHAPTTRWR